MPLPHSRPRASPPPFDTLSRSPCACRTLSSSLCDRVSRVSAPPRRGTRTSGLFHGGLEAWTPREARGTHSRLDRCFSPAHGASSAPRCQYTSSRISARRRAPTAALVPGSDRGALFLGQNTRHSHFPVAALPLRAALGMPREAPRAHRSRVELLFVSFRTVKVGWRPRHSRGNPPAHCTAQRDRASCFGRRMPIVFVFVANAEGSSQLSPAWH